MSAATVSELRAKLRIADLPPTFTQEFLDRAVARLGAPYALFESDTPGFCVRVTAMGTGTYCFRSTVKGGASRTVKIDRVGSIPLKTARARALELKVQMQNGVDPRVRASALVVVEIVTLDDMLTYWLANTTATAKTKDENERVVRQWLQPWLQRDYRTISKKDEHEYRHGFEARTAHALQVGGYRVRQARQRRHACHSEGARQHARRPRHGARA